MTIEYCDILRDLHVALDEIIIGDAQNDDFATDMDTELTQAVNSAVEQLLNELDESHIDLKDDPSVTATAGTGTHRITIPSDMLRFVAVSFRSWGSELRELTPPDSDKAKMQRCAWTMGTKYKPVAIMTTSGTTKILQVYGTSANEPVTRFLYVPMPAYTNTSVTCALREEARKCILYRAAGIYLETHREPDAAEKYYELSRGI